MARLTAADHAGVLEVLRVAEDADGSDAFPPPVLEALRRLIPCYSVSYGDLDLERAPGWRFATRWVGEPPALPTPELTDALRRLKAQDPLPPWGADVCNAMRLSDRLSRRELRRLEFYSEFLHPLGCEYELRLWLVGPEGVLGGFDFDRQRRDFSARDRLVLDTLAPHLVYFRRKAKMRDVSNGAAAALTQRERAVLGHVASGLTNRQIAAVLCVAPGTVRKHLDNIYAKLGVGNRAAAVALTGIGRDRSPAD